MADSTVAAVPTTAKITVKAATESPLVAKDSTQKFDAAIEKILEPVAMPAPISEVVTQKAELEPVSSGATTLDWPGLHALIEGYENCPSCGPHNAYLGGGDTDADWMFVSDAPNSREIQEQTLFTGRAGQLFDAILLALRLDRSKVYSTSVFKCAPTDDLSLTPQCDMIVQRQIDLVAPRVVVTLGEFAAQAVIKANEPLDTLRVKSQRCFRTNVAIVPTYSLTEMLDQPDLKAFVWADLKKCLTLIEKNG